MIARKPHLGGGVRGDTGEQFLLGCLIGFMESLESYKGPPDNMSYLYQFICTFTNSTKIRHK